MCSPFAEQQHTMMMMMMMKNFHNKHVQMILQSLHVARTYIYEVNPHCSTSEDGLFCIIVYVMFTSICIYRT